MREEKEKVSLSQREMDVLTLISDGASNEEIAKKFGISPNTARVHIYNIFKKINAHNRFQAILWVIKNLE
jgi:LuxR family transcriptional regulator of csgAB operon